MKKFYNLHLHTHFSNATTIPEVVNKPKEYIDYAIDKGLEAIAFTEHGNVLSWVDKKIMANSHGLKYIHGVEAYVTDTLEENIRDNFHLILLAKNYEGVKELNRLISLSFRGCGNKQAENKHYYYAPRITFDELTQTSDNIIILTGCLGSALYQHHKNNNTLLFDKWLNFFVEQKHRVWLEFQPHNIDEQKSYNQLLYDLSKRFSMNTIATNDVHAIDSKSNELRQLLMKSKGIEFDEEHEGLECWLKDYDEMYYSFLEQGVLSEEFVCSILNETERLVGMIEDFDFDYSFKYPQLYSDSVERFENLIKVGMDEKGINNLPKEERKKYVQRIKKEYNIYKELDTINYMLLTEYIVSSARKANKFFGYGRGSVNGSLIAYLLGITEIDSIKENLNFERFMNPDRVSLPDIDSDISGVGEHSDREWVTDFLINNDKFNCACIVTYNTLGLPGAIKDVARALGYTPDLANAITKQIDDKTGELPQSVVSEYFDLVNKAKKLIGTITSIGRHAGGYLVATRDIVSELGCIEVSKSSYPVTAVAMKEIDKLNYVKLDILGLDNIGLINMTCELAGLDRATPQSEYINFNDKEVMKDLRNSTIGIFQFEGQRAEKLVRDMFSEDVQDRMQRSGVNTDPVNQLAFLNAAMRPGASSIIEDIVKGKVHDNGHFAINEMLEQTLGYLIYQESIIEWLVKFCGRTNADADNIRRAIGKKKLEVLEQEIPKIKQEFIQTMVEKYGDTKEHASDIVDSFMTIIHDASNYSFSRNHAIPYSYIGYISAWLRYYYPLEFLTAAFTTFADDQEKVNHLKKYAEMRGIKIEPVKFGYSKGDYFFDKETNAIYEGVRSIKGNNKKTGDLLYEFSKKCEKGETSFINMLLKLKETSSIKLNHDDSEEIVNVYNLFLNGSIDEVVEVDKKIKQVKKEGALEVSTDDVSIDKNKMLSLIRLNYFREFGGNKKLENLFNAFLKEYKVKNKVLKGKFEAYKGLVETEEQSEDEMLPVFQQFEYELDYLGKCRSIRTDISKKYAFVEKVDIRSRYVRATVYSIHTGKTISLKIPMKQYRLVKVREKDVVEIIDYVKKPKKIAINGTWTNHPTEKEFWLNEYKTIRKGD